MTPNLQSGQITLASKQVASVSANGSYLLLSSATGAFQYSIDGGPWELGLTVLGVDLRPYKFKEIIFRNLTTASNIISYYVADTKIDLITPVFFTKDAPTYPKAQAPAILANNGTVAPAAVDTGGQIQKYVIVHNLDPAVILVVTDGTNPIISLPPNSPPARIDTSSAIVVLNQSGAGMTQPVYVTPFYYQ